MADQDAAPPGGMSGDGQRITVLLVDDQRIVGVVLERLLATERDIEFHWCLNPVEAVARATELRATVILQDLVLPDTDGFTMVRRFRADPSTARTPVVVLSATDDADTRARARAAGANDYLVKLPAKNDLIACIRRQAIAAGAANPQKGTAA